MFGFVVSLVAGFIYKVDVIARDSGGWLVDLMYVVFVVLIQWLPICVIELQNILIILPLYGG